MSGQGAAKTFKKKTNDAQKKQNGEMAPDVDQDGKMINPHNPDFITKVPWYLGNSGPTLKHHNIQKSDHFLSLSEADFHAIFFVDRGRSTQSFSLCVVAPQFLQEPFLNTFCD